MELRNATALATQARLRNPLYHWTHLELQRYFGIRELLDETTAKQTWDRANEMLQLPELTAQGILAKFRVRALCTTDDPCDDLLHHETLRKTVREFRVSPAFRPDNALLVQSPAEFNKWVSENTSVLL